jgi:glutamyl-tRNA synthetase
VLEAIGAPHEGASDDEPVYPKEFRPPAGSPLPPLGEKISVNWRFRVPDAQQIVFEDARFGQQRSFAGRDFGDFLVWRKDDVPSYQLACAVDDAEMKITEVVRGSDLIKSTFRQILIIRALGHVVPQYYHCPLMTDDKGERLAKRHDALSLRSLRERGVSPDQILSEFTREFADNNQ